LRAAALLARYGYAAVLVGSFFEGETIVLMGGFSVHQGYLHLPGVIACAFAGSLAGDQIAYLLGRRYGEPVLERRPKWRPHVELVRHRLENHGTWLLVFFRFLYGLRNIVPFAAGLTGIRPRKFIPLNVLGAALWAPTITILGYLFGQAFEKVLVHARRYEEFALIALVVVGLVLFAISHFRKKDEL
jgi:membrane protein DedA with SNARE-associated domain